MRRLTLTLLLLFILHLSSLREISCAAHGDDLYRVPSLSDGIVNASNASNSTDHDSSPVAGSEKK